MGLLPQTVWARDGLNVEFTGNPGRIDMKRWKERKWERERIRESERQRESVRAEFKWR